MRILFQATEGEDAMDLDQAVRLLPGPERARAARFHFARDRDRWIRGRAWVRQELGASLGLSPEAVEIFAEPGGRLSVPGAGLDFNLSHTGGWIGLGICQKGKIGLDLETVDPAFPSREIAAEFFLPEECAWIADGPVERFFQLWTAKEALMKATGLGMSLEPGQIRVGIQNDAPISVTQLETGIVHPVRVWPGPGGTMAAVVWLPEPGESRPAAQHDLENE